MCFHLSRNTGKFFLLLLALCSLSLPVFSYQNNSDGSRTYSKAEMDLIAQEMKNLQTSLDSLKATNQQQADKIQSLVTELETARTLQNQLMQTINLQKTQLTMLNSSLTSSSQTLESTKVWEIIGWTLCGVSLVGNAGQALAYKLKP